MPNLSLTINAQDFLVKDSWGELPTAQFNLPNMSLTLTVTDVYPAPTDADRNMKYELEQLQQSFRELRSQLDGMYAENRRLRDRNVELVRATCNGDEVRRAALAHLPGNVINAIKEVRALTGLELKKAKDYIDALQDEIDGGPKAPVLDVLAR